MTVHIMIAPVLIFTGIYVAVGGYFLISYYRIPQLRSNHVLWFIAACFLSAAYTITRIGMYYTTSCEMSYFWVMAAHVMIPVLAITIAGFLNHFADKSNKWITFLIMYGFGLLSVAALLGGDYVMDSTTCFTSAIQFFGTAIPRVRIHPGPIAMVIYGYLLCSIFYAGFYVYYFGINMERKEKKAFSLGILFLLIAAVIDTAVSLKLISFIFVGEYAFFFFIVAMCYSTINEISGHLVEKRIQQHAKENTINAEEQLKIFDIDSIKQRLNSLMEDEKVYMDENVTLVTVANRLGIHPSKFSLFMNAVMKIDFRNFINQHRIEEARHLLETDQDVSIKYVCYEVGFKSKSAFYNAFKKFLGTTPSDYKKTLSG